ncbi:hypothetical protein [Brevibacillus migulae]|uniref:hypothetical protein n=1 Tax=Brevibacillus migulae TaxID=1644114 RepID=UPI001F46B39B|nr:hypothetical protein [Brevibacillus migulae]
MGINVLSVSTLLLFLLVGLVVVDTDIAMQKKAEMKTLIELANHHATFAIDEALKTEGIIDMVEADAMNRFDQRMGQNGNYTREGNFYQPSAESVTTDPVAIINHYIDFQQWRYNTKMFLHYDGESLQMEKLEREADPKPTVGGELRIAITMQDNQTVNLPPKMMIGPSHVVVAYVDERPLVPLLPAHAFPVASVEELKW